VSGVLIDPDLVRYIVAGLSCTVSGAVLVVFARYAIATVRAGKAPGRLLLRHVTLVTLGTLGLVATLGYRLYQTAGTTPVSSAVWIYLASMLTLLAAMIDVGAHLRRHDRPPGPRNPT
jgi:hypothetical protein